MCAIAGILNLKIDEQTEKKMLETMRRRGPDGGGTYESEGCTLLHARLAVIDPEGGAQPMALIRGDEEYAMVYNGELYNTAELRRELEALGHHFQTHSDTEVLLHGCVEWGSGVLDRCNGIFAFALWEKRRRRLTIARDRIGVKPLFFKEHEGGFLFASEIKTLLAYPTVRPQIDETGVGELLLLGPGRTPGSGVFRGIRELEPGYWGQWEDGRLRLTQYWKLRDREHRESFLDTSAHVRELVLDAIHRQLVSDVPIGTFLSGGLDSSLISAVSATELAAQGKALQTFSVDYTDNDKYFVPSKFQPNSDAGFIALMRDFLPGKHHSCVLSAQDLVDEIENGTYARDLPGMADVDLSLLAFCRQIKNHVTVALSGECADEIFGGYPWYRDPKVRETDGFPWAQNTELRGRILAPEYAARLDPEAFVRSRYIQTLEESDILPGTSPLETRMKQMVNLNFRWFMQTLLDRKDRMSMFSGLEVRVPFCDYRIAEYLYGVPWEMKDYEGREKGLLRHAMEGLLPREVLYRKKSPYPKTFDPRYLTLVSARLQTILENKNAPLFQIVDRDAVRRVLFEDLEWPWYGQLMRRPQLICYLLQLSCWLETYRVELC